jgi:UDP-N-acetylmuramoyl-tripeptide--D-alanyl-D-alanine ligase
MFKSYIQKKLEKYVRTYLRRHPEVKVVAVVGSVGKTTTKIAIGTVLSRRFKIRLHEGNHNSEISAPLAMLGIDFPDNIRKIGEWRKVFRAARRRIREPADVDVIVQEVGTDGIGQIPHFGTYVTPDITVVTAVSPEHMEYFGTIDKVAEEELSAVNYSKQAIINRDDIDGEFAKLITNQNISTYGTSAAAEYSLDTSEVKLDGAIRATLKAKEWEAFDVELNVVGEAGTRAVAAAAAVAVKLGMTAQEVAEAVVNVRPVKGRMNILRGVDESVIIDDTYNSSPLAAAAALRVLYKLQAPQKIAVLGSMNELGAVTVEAHDVLGSLCDPSQLAFVITVGDDAAKYLAPAAKRNGCQVVSFKSALEAGAYAHRVMESGAVMLFKGSQGEIFLEEAVKIVLHSTEEEASLVRQSPAWLEKKRAFFESLSNAPAES